ncbi:TetR/AcrR family transcriptional regulator [Actinocorallia lasiicapitis]
MTTDGRLLRGEQTRKLILGHAMDIASAEGLEALSIGRLATDLGISKSGLFAHFGAKEELQLATLAAGREVFREQVVAPARTAPQGLPRLESLLEHWLSYAERRTFPGGCIVYSIAAEFDARPGRIRDRVAELRTEWSAYLVHSVEVAIEQGEIRRGTDPAQLVFELDAYVWAAVGATLLYDSPEPLARARTALAARLALVTPDAPR